MAHKVDPAYPERGWGQALRALVSPSLRRVNHAMNGRSTKSFRDLSHWDNLLARTQPGDWVVFQFGHNDAKQDDPARFAATTTDYPANLRRFIAELRAKGAHPVLATPVVRGEGEKEGTLRDTHGACLEAVRKVAAVENVPLLNLEAATEMKRLNLPYASSLRSSVDPLGAGQTNPAH